VKESLHKWVLSPASFPFIKKLLYFSLIKSLLELDIKLSWYQVARLEATLMLPLLYQVVALQGGKYTILNYFIVCWGGSSHIKWGRITPPQDCITGVTTSPPPNFQLLGVATSISKIKPTWYQAQPPPNYFIVPNLFISGSLQLNCCLNCCL
jgi:hypothetical protein